MYPYLRACCKFCLKRVWASRNSLFCEGDGVGDVDSMTDGYWGADGNGTPYCDRVCDVDRVGYVDGVGYINGVSNIYSVGNVDRVSKVNGMGNVDGVSNIYRMRDIYR